MVWEAQGDSDENRFQVGDRVRVKEGTFKGLEGEVTKVEHSSGVITVLVSVFGRITPVEMEHWQAESA